MTTLAVSANAPLTLRQGGFLLLPRPWLQVPSTRILRDQRIRLSRSQSHQCENVFRPRGGQALYLRGNFQKGSDHPLTLPYWHKLVQVNHS